MAVNIKLAKAIAKKLYKTKHYYIHGDIRKKITSNPNLFDDLKVSFKGIEEFSKGSLLDLSEEGFKTHSLSFNGTVRIHN